MSAANNIINWEFLIKSGQIQEASGDEDYILVGSFNTGRKSSSTASRDREYLIKTSDFLAQAGGSAENTWDVATAAFVDPANGDNSTAVVGDGNKPFLDVTTAQALTKLVILKPGNYSETINFQDQMTYYCMPGVVFIAGGWLDLVENGKTVNILGFADYTGSSRALALNSDATVYFEFNRVLDANDFLFVQRGSTVHMNGKSILCNGLNGVGATMTVRDTANVNITIAEFCYGQRATCFFRNGAVGNYSGTFTINCPDIKLLDDYTGVPGTTNRACFMIDNCNGANITINGNMTNEYALLGTAYQGCVSMANHTVGASNITINGDMDGGPANPCFHSWFQSQLGNITINGNLTTGSIAPISTAYTGSDVVATQFIDINNSKIISGGFPNIIGRGKEVYFRNCSLHILGSLLAGSLVTHDVGGSSTTSSVYTYNCIAELNGGAVELFDNFATVTLGCWNTVGNIPLGATAVDTFTGYTNQAGIKVPKF